MRDIEILLRKCYNITMKQKQKKRKVGFYQSKEFKFAYWKMKQQEKQFADAVANY